MSSFLLRSCGVCRLVCFPWNVLFFFAFKKLVDKMDGPTTPKRARLDNASSAAQSPASPSNSPTCGFLHAVKGLREKGANSFFEFHIQTENDVLRGLCFDKSKHSIFIKYSSEKTPVSISAAPKSDKRDPGQMVLMVGSYTKVSGTSSVQHLWQKFENPNLVRAVFFLHIYILY